jgi:hypothetical protein
VLNIYSKPVVIAAVNIDPGIVFPCLHNRQIIWDRPLGKIMERILNACSMGRRQLKTPIAYSRGHHNGPI